MQRNHRYHVLVYRVSITFVFLSLSLDLRDYRIILVFTAIYRTSTEDYVDAACRYGALYIQDLSTRATWLQRLQRPT